MSRCPLLLLLLLLGLERPLLAQAPPASKTEASPAEKEQLRTLVREAGQLMDRGDRAGAVAKLQQARRLRPDPSLDYNLGVAYADWGKAPEAAGSFSRFLQGVTPEAVTRDRVEDARRRLKDYAAQLARVSVELPAANGAARVIIDNVTLGPPPLAGHWLGAGTHEVRVTAPGCRDFTVSVTVAAGEERAISAEVQPLSNQGAAFVPDLNRPPEPPPPLYKRWWLWTAVGGGAVVAAGLIGAAAAGRFNHVAPGADLPAVEVGR